MNQNDVIGGAAVPLTDALPCGHGEQRTLLVNDSIGADGRFLLYTLAKEVIATKGRVLWLACGPTTPTQILQGLKKLGCDKQSSQQSLTVRNLILEWTEFLGSQEEASEASFLKRVYQSIDAWRDSSPDDSKRPDLLLVLDDASAFANLLGERLVYSWILAVNAKCQRHDFKAGFLVRCSNDAEKEALPTFAGSSVGQQDWFGAGAASAVAPSSIIPWERALVEMADGVLDVLPLTSGYTRELQGRIVLTRMPQGRGWGDKYDNGASSSTQPRKQQVYPPMQIINYGITDQKIVAYIM